jgi:hypothetical protein
LPWDEENAGSQSMHHPAAVIMVASVDNACFDYEVWEWTWKTYFVKECIREGLCDIHVWVSSIIIPSSLCTRRLCTETCLKL